MSIQQAVLDDDDLYYTDMPVGEILRRARMHYGQSLREVERILRIRASQIEAIEEGRYDSLPGRVYAIGFIRAYSDYLGLDADRMVQLFKIQAGGKTNRPILHFPAGASDSKTAPLWLVFFSLVIISGIAVLWYVGQSERRVALRNIAPPVAEAPASEVDAQPEVPFNPDAMGPFLPQSEPAAPEAQQPVLAPPPSDGIILNVVESSWVEIRDREGNPIVSRVLKAGERYYVPDNRPDLTMSLGNAGGVRIELDGNTLQPLGAPGEVLKDVPLAAETLKKTYSLNP